MFKETAEEREKRIRMERAALLLWWRCEGRGRGLRYRRAALAWYRNIRTS